MRTFFLFYVVPCNALMSLRGAKRRGNLPEGNRIAFGAMLPSARCCLRNDVCLWHDMSKTLCDIKMP